MAAFPCNFSQYIGLFAACARYKTRARLAVSGLQQSCLLDCLSSCCWCAQSQARDLSAGTHRRRAPAWPRSSPARSRAAPTSCRNSLCPRCLAFWTRTDSRIAPRQPCLAQNFWQLTAMLEVQHRHMRDNAPHVSRAARRGRRKRSRCPSPSAAIMDKTASSMDVQLNCRGQRSPSFHLQPLQDPRLAVPPCLKQHRCAVHL